MQSAKDRQTPPAAELVSLKGLRTLGIEWCRVHLMRLVHTGQFPRPLRPTGGRLFWVRSEVEQWIAERAAERDADSAPPANGSAR